MIMEILINIGIIIGILVITILSIKLLFFILGGLLCLWAKIYELIEDRKHIKKWTYGRNKETAEQILDIVEDLLSKYDIKIPNSNRKNAEDETSIYGDDYYNLEEQIIEILNDK